MAWRLAIKAEQFLFAFSMFLRSEVRIGLLVLVRERVQAQDRLSARDRDHR